LLIEGVDVLRTVDVYTGRLLWEVRLPGLGKFYNNLAHQPGANAIGTNFISTSDGVYVAHGPRCLKLDPATGRKLAEFTLPALTPPAWTRPGSPSGKQDAPLWGYLNVAGDYLIGGADPQLDPKLFQPLLVGGDDPVPGSTAEKPADPLGSLFKKIPRMDNDNL